MVEQKSQKTTLPVKLSLDTTEAKEYIESLKEVFSNKKKHSKLVVVGSNPTILVRQFVAQMDRARKNNFLLNCLLTMFFEIVSISL